MILPFQVSHSVIVSDAPFKKSHLVTIRQLSIHENVGKSFGDRMSFLTPTSSDKGRDAGIWQPLQRKFNSASVPKSFKSIFFINAVLQKLGFRSLFFIQMQIVVWVKHNFRSKLSDSCRGTFLYFNDFFSELTFGFWFLSRLHKQVTGRQQDKQNLAIVERRLVEERKQKVTLENQLATEKRRKAEETALAASRAAAATPVLRRVSQDHVGHNSTLSFQCSYGYN